MTAERINAQIRNAWGEPVILAPEDIWQSAMEWSAWHSYRQNHNPLWRWWRRLRGDYGPPLPRLTGYVMTEYFADGSQRTLSV